MIKINYKNFTEKFIDKDQDYLDENPATDYSDTQIELNDLYLDDRGNIVYLYSARVKSYFDKDSYQTTNETTDEKYVILLTRDQIKTI